MMLRVLSAALLAAGLLVPAPARADIKLPALFSDGLVLQQGDTVPLYGTANPGEPINVTFEAMGEYKGAGFRAQGAAATAADQTGKWRVDLATKGIPPGGPYKLTFKGKNTIVLKEVYLGEVWLCSGQSNMEWRLKSMVVGGPEAIAASKNPKIRLFTVASKRSAQPETDVKGQWVECGPMTVGDFSAVGYFFGRDLQKALDVPVGLINSSVGGTASEEWTSMKTLQAHPAHLNQERMKQATLYNGMIAPLMPYAIRGVIWYQGESNAGRAQLYREGFPLMIQNWREDWKQGDFPFLFVQLAPFQTPTDQPTDHPWARLRDAQLETTRKVKHTGMAVITDAGEAEIHPKKKEPVGARLALLALANVYGEKIEASGPVYEDMKVEGDKAVLSFSHVGQGLMTRGEKLTGFTIAGADGKFVNAEAEIKGDKIVVSSPQVKEPKAVRFGWAIYPVVNLWNKDGLPASPFRTDDWPVGGPKK
jgi:sialate O-acetylesterase